MDALAALLLQIEWGADEALGSEPVDRTQPTGPQPVFAMSHFAPSRDAVAPAPAPLAFAAPTRAMVASVTLADPVRAARGAADAATTLVELEAAMRDFTGCALSLTATSLVFGAGPAPALLMIVGDAPGETEDRSGQPLDGPAGELLARMLASIGLDMAAIRRVPVLPWRPPGGRPPNEAEVAVCLPFLHRHIALAQPSRLLALGALAARTLLGSEAPISRLRGRWANISVPHRAATLPVLPLLHPGQLAARPEQKALAWRDLRLLRRSIDESLTQK